MRGESRTEARRIATREVVWTEEAGHSEALQHKESDLERVVCSQSKRVAGGAQKCKGGVGRSQTM